MVRKKLWRQLAAFSVLLLPAIVYSYGMVLDADLPNPSRLIEAMIKPLAQQLEQLLGTKQ